MVSFVKMHGLGNDFVVINLDENKNLTISTDFVKKICDRKYGIGADQLVIISTLSFDAVLMQIYNNDGSKSDACGNATRCIAKLLKNITNLKIHTSSGDIIQTDATDEDNIISELPQPKFAWHQIPLSKEFNNFINFHEFQNLPEGYFINVGNPHIVFFVDDINSINIGHYGKILESHNYFPEKVNVNFAAISDNNKINLITYERGSGLTLACGTGAAATAVAAVTYKNITGEITISMPGGDLKVTYNKNDSKIITCGQAISVFNGEFYD